jgi:hypothetical protein
MYKMNPPGLFDLPVEVRGIIFKNVLGMSNRETLNRNRIIDRTLDTEHENLEELRMINNAAFFNQNLMNNPQLFAEYRQRVINIRTGEADYLRLIQDQERMLDNHDLRMKTYRMMLKTREERMNN